VPSTADVSPKRFSVVLTLGEVFDAVEFAEVAVEGDSG
jgi:hypothetical protein